MTFKFSFVMCLLLALLAGCASGPTAVSPSAAPEWVSNKNKAFPDADWLAVVAEGANTGAAESAAMNALARAFEVDLQSLTTANQEFTSIVSQAAGKKSVSVTQSQGFGQEVTTNTNVSGLLGVQTDSWTAANGTVYVVARMNRRECAARYHAMMKENERNVVNLIAQAGRVPGTFDAYAGLSFAARIATVNDNFQSIAHVLSPSQDSRFSYGNADAVRTLAQRTAASITIGIAVTGDVGGRVAKAFGSFFSDRGFKTGGTGNAPFTLSSTLTLEESDFGPGQTTVFINYTLDAMVSARGGSEVFTYSGSGRKGHATMQQTRQLVLRTAETSITDADEEDGFATAFDGFLSSLLSGNTGRMACIK
ncbi:MAG: hypothetical protein LBS97_00435 [Treponema sp.]|nr:hypothetical protein [Treponema sp.]